MRTSSRFFTEGVPVVGFTWFPLFTMIDWRYRQGRAPAADYRVELGLYRLNAAGVGPRWQATPLLAQVRAAIADPLAAIGPFVPAPSAPPPADDPLTGARRLDEG